MRTIVLILVSISSVSAFMGVCPPRQSSITQLNGGGSGYATSLDGKKETVELVKSLLDSSNLVFAVPASAVSVSQAQQLRRAMPEGTTCKVIKNKLMARAVEGSAYEPLSKDMLKGANMWFFIDDDVSGTIKSYNDYLKDTNKRETHEILGGCMEGTVYDGSGIQQIGKLPSKQDLYAMIARSINMVPTKLARVVKAPGDKLARAIKLATDPDKDKDSSE
jgi:large subunit ribosomal protein L10